MLIGYNNDVKYRGKVFHIQTEDRGNLAMQIETQIFHAGAILDTRIVSYEDLIAGESDQEARNRTIKTLMQKTHKELYRNLFSGGYDHFVGLEPRGTDKVEEVEEDAEDFTPGQDGVPEAAIALEQDGKLTEELKGVAGGEHIDLSSLKSRLAKVSSPEISEPEEEAAKPASVSGMLKPVLSLNKKPAPKVSAPSSVKRAPSKSLKNSADPIASWGQTGVQAWQGCEPSTSDLDLVKLVDALL